MQLYSLCGYSALYSESSFVGDALPRWLHVRCQVSGELLALFEEDHWDSVWGSAFPTRVSLFYRWRETLIFGVFLFCLLFLPLLVFVEGRYGDHFGFSGQAFLAAALSHYAAKSLCLVLVRAMVVAQAYQISQSDVLVDPPRSALTNPLSWWR